MRTHAIALPRCGKIFASKLDRSGAHFAARISDAVAVDEVHPMDAPPLKRTPYVASRDFSLKGEIVLLPNGMKALRRFGAVLR